MHNLTKSIFPFLAFSLSIPLLSGCSAEAKLERRLKHADRSFNDAWGPIEDYRDGYQQGFRG